MKKLVFTFFALMIVASSYSLNLSTFDSLNMSQIVYENQIVSTLELSMFSMDPEDDPCLDAYNNTYNANVEQYGPRLAASMAQAAWNACQDAQITPP